MESIVKLSLVSIFNTSNHNYANYDTYFYRKVWIFFSKRVEFLFSKVNKCISAYFFLFPRQFKCSYKFASLYTHPFIIYVNLNLAKTKMVFIFEKSYYNVLIFSRHLCKERENSKCKRPHGYFKNLTL